MQPYWRNELLRAEREERLRRADRQRATGGTSPGLLARLLRRWRQRPSAPSLPALAPSVEIRIRTATAEEATVLRELQNLRGDPPSSAPVLLAEVDGSTAAALSLDAGLLMSQANPPLPELNELLHLRAVQLLRAEAAEGQANWEADLSRPARRFSRRSRRRQGARCGRIDGS